MPEMSCVYAGTVRSAAGGSGGIFRQTAGDQRWEALTNGLPDETQVHAITVHPANPEVVFIGTTKGAFRSADRGGRWKRLALADPEADIWSITVVRPTAGPFMPAAGQSASTAARMTAITGRNCPIRGSPTGCT